MMDDFKFRSVQWNLKEEELDRCLWRTWYGSGCGLVVILQDYCGDYADDERSICSTDDVQQEAQERHSTRG